MGPSSDSQCTSAPEEVKLELSVGFYLPPPSVMPSSCVSKSLCFFLPLSPSLPFSLTHAPHALTVCVACPAVHHCCYGGAPRATRRGAPGGPQPQGCRRPQLVLPAQGRRPGTGMQASLEFDGDFGDGCFAPQTIKEVSLIGAVIVVSTSSTCLIRFV